TEGTKPSKARFARHGAADSTSATLANGCASQRQPLPIPTRKRGRRSSGYRVTPKGVPNGSSFRRGRRYVASTRYSLHRTAGRHFGRSPAHTRSGIENLKVRPADLPI